MKKGEELAVIGGMAIAGGIIYFILKRQQPPPPPPPELRITKVYNVSVTY